MNALASHSAEPTGSLLTGAPQLVRVLLVEDNPGDARLLQEYLSDGGQTYFQLVHESRMSSALQRLQQEPCDVLLLDLSLPDSSGLETFRRAHEVLPAVPIVVLTGLDDEEMALKAVQEGAQDYLVKGKVTGDLLSRALRYAVERHSSRVALQRAINDLELRVSERTAALRETNGQLQRQLELRNVAETQLQRQLQRMAALRTIDIAIISSFDLRMTLSVFLEQVNTQVGVDASAVLIFNPQMQKLDVAAVHGWHMLNGVQNRLRLDDDFAGKAVIERRLVFIPDIKQGDLHGTRSGVLIRENFVSYYGVPLVAKGQVKGVLEIFNRTPLESDSEREEFLESLATQAAIAIDNSELFDEIQRSHVELALAYETTLEGWSRASDWRDRESEGHTQRLVDITIRLGRAVGLSEAELVHVRRGVLLHDIGKMAVPDAILHKNGPLDDEEWIEVRKHPAYSAELLNPIVYLRPALEIPLYHHEKWDGSGYPYGLKGETIPLAARVFAVVDVWDALRSQRPFRSGWPEERVREYLREQSGIQFDPKIVAVFLADVLDIHNPAPGQGW